MASGDDDLTRFVLAGRFSKPWRGRVRTRPKMPSGAWRVAAVACTAVGALVAWLIFRNSGALGWRMVAGAGVGFAVGIYVVETMWERRARSTAADGPIGRRR